jgi:protein-tyrosine-phosphatase
MIVHFICRGNAHRSIMAEAYLKSLQLKGVQVRSSGSVADLYRQHNLPILATIVSMLRDYGVGSYAKSVSDQLSQQRIDGADITVCMNQIVYDESSKITTLPKNTIVWNVMDAGEGHRIVKQGEDQYKYTKEVYDQIVGLVDGLVAQNINLL